SSILPLFALRRNEPAMTHPTPITAWPSEDQLAHAVTGVLEAEEAPGAIVRLSAPGLDPWIGTFGVANRETGTPMQADMRGRIGSITKTMVATLILQLVDAGALDLDGTLATILPAAADLPNAETITLRNLLSMRSGLFNYTQQPGVFDTIIDQPDRVWTPQELIAVAAGKPANFAPGTEFEYSNTNYILLGEIVGHLTGQPVEEVFRERLVDPLGLTATTWPRDSGLPAPFADGYARVPLDEAPKLDAPPDGPTKIVPATIVDASAGGAAGAVISTVEDMDHWIDCLIEGRVLDPATSRAQLDVLPILKPDGEPSGMGYGLGIADFAGIVGHNGGIPGFQSFAGRIMALGVNVSVIVNIDMGADGKQPADAIAYALRALLAESVAPKAAS
ncbi:MAG: serine hydrolase domain-containing protein, partial [Thermomicrobiales bacterium]